MLLQSILKAGLGKACDGLFGVVHAHGNAWPIKLVHLPGLLLSTASRGENKLQLARLLHPQVCCPVLIAKGVPAGSNKGTSILTACVCLELLCIAVLLDSLSTQHSASCDSTQSMHCKISAPATAPNVLVHRHTHVPVFIPYMTNLRNDVQKDVYVMPGNFWQIEADRNLADAE